MARPSWPVVPVIATRRLLLKPEYASHVPNILLDRPDDTISEQMYVHEFGGTMPVTAYVHPT
jgi:hypothetical protein